MKTQFDLEFTATPSVIRTARDAAAVIASEIPEDRVDDVRLLVSELVTNSIRHGGLASTDWVRVRLSMGQGKIRTEVHDSGKGFEPPTVPVDPFESGRGSH